MAPWINGGPKLFWTQPLPYQVISLWSLMLCWKTILTCTNFHGTKWTINFQSQTSHCNESILHHEWACTCNAFSFKYNTHVFHVFLFHWIFKFESKNIHNHFTNSKIFNSPLIIVLTQKKMKIPSCRLGFHPIVKVLVKHQLIVKTWLPMNYCRIKEFIMTWKAILPFANLKENWYTKLN